MEYFSVVYRILKAVYDSMDYPEFDRDCISAEALGISMPKWSAIMAELVRNEYIRGVTVHEHSSASILMIRIVRPTLTLKGAEYLEDNTMMKKVQHMMKGIKGAVPGI